MDFRHYLHVLFDPANIAVIGASEKKESLGYAMWSHLNQGGFKSPIFPVNPKYKTLGSAKCYSSLSALKQDIELAIIVCPPTHYEKVLSECLETKVKAILLCGGYSKTELTEKIYKKIGECTAAGILVVGPQSLGYLHPSTALNASFLPTLPEKGNIGLISQSPGLVHSIINIASGCKNGFSYVIDPGLEYSLYTADFIDLLAQDPQTQCIVLYIENFKNPRKLLSAIRLASKSKPVIVLKGGKYKTSADIVINNNGQAQEDNEVIEKALRRSGALLLNSIYDLSYAIQAFALRRELFPGAIYAITNSKGLDTLVADQLFKFGIEPVSITPETAAVLSEKFKILYPFANPINAGLDASPKHIAALMDFVLKQSDCSGVLMTFTSNPIMPPIEFAKALVAVVEKSEKPVVTAWLGSGEIEPAIKYLLSKGVPALEGVRNACMTLSLMEKFFGFRNRQRIIFHNPPLLSDRSFSGVRKIIQQAKKENRNLIYEEEAKRILASLGFETTLSITAGSSGEAIEAAKAIGYPVAMKIRTDGILSKSDIGGVILGIRNEKELRNAYKFLISKAEENFIPEEDVAVSIQKTLSDENARELKIGVRTTNQFGPIVYIGIGGMYGDLGFKEEFNFAPLSKVEALELLNSPSIDKLLKPYKGLPAVNKDVLCTALLRLSQLVTAVPALKSLEIDPFLCGPDAAIVLDAHATIYDKPSRSTFSSDHLVFPAIQSKPAKKVTGEFGELLLKQAQPSDAIQFEQYINELSDNSKRLRFHGVNVTAEALTANTLGNDPDRSFTVVLTDSQKNSPQIRGEATFSLLPNARTAEFGVSVADSFQKKGLSKFLMTALEEEASARGLTQLIGYVLNDNFGMNKMMISRGYKAVPDENDPHVTLYTLDLENRPQSTDR